MRLYITDSTSCITGSAVKSILGKSRDTVFIVPEPAKAQVERCVINTLAGMNGGGAFKASVRDKTKTIPVTAAFADGTCFTKEYISYLTSVLLQLPCFR